jgi:hypothetical protein
MIVQSNSTKLIIYFQKNKAPAAAINKPCTAYWISTAQAAFIGSAPCTAALVDDWKSVAVKDGKAVAVNVRINVEKTVRVENEVKVRTCVWVRGVNAVVVMTRVLVWGTIVHFVFDITLVVLSVLVLGTNVVRWTVVVLTNVRVVVVNVVSTLVVVLVTVVVVKVIVVIRFVLVMVRTELIKVVTVARSVLVRDRVLVEGKVKISVRVFVVVVRHVLVTVVVDLLVTVIISSQSAYTGRINNWIEKRNMSRIPWIDFHAIFGMFIPNALLLNGILG